LDSGPAGLNYAPRSAGGRTGQAQLTGGIAQGEQHLGVLGFQAQRLLELGDGGMLGDLLVFFNRLENDPGCDQQVQDQSGGAFSDFANDFCKDIVNYAAQNMGGEKAKGKGGGSWKCFFDYTTAEMMKARMPYLMLTRWLFIHHYVCVFCVTLVLTHLCILRF